MTSKMTNKFSPEVRAVRMVTEHEAERPFAMGGSLFHSRQDRLLGAYAQ
jgi:hypothetical protein